MNILIARKPGRNVPWGLFCHQDFLLLRPRDRVFLYFLRPLDLLEDQLKAEKRSLKMKTDGEGPH